MTQKSKSSCTLDACALPHVNKFEIKSEVNKLEVITVEYWQEAELVPRQLC